MQNMQRWALTLLSMLCLAGVVLLAVQNLALSAPVQLFTWTLEGITLGGLLALSALLGGLCVLFRMMVTIQAIRTDARKANRERERTEVSAEESGQRVKALEAKIQTLEKALQDALQTRQT